MNNAEGADVSKWDGGPDDNLQVIDFDLYGAAWPFIKIKVSEGVVEDRLFRRQWNAARGHTVRQAYHFWRESVDQKAAARKVVAILGGDQGEMPVALDFEDPYDTEAALSKAHVWADEYHALTGLWPWMYSTFWKLINRGSGRKTILGTFKNAWLRNCRLWLAQYPFDELDSMAGYPQHGDALRAVLIQEVIDGKRQLTWPIAPWPWDGNQVGVWQWTSRFPPGLVPGYYTGPNGKDAVDHNFDVLSKEVFWATYPIGGGTEPPPPGGGSGMYLYAVKVNVDSLNVRAGPGATFTDIGDLFRGQLAEGNQLETDQYGNKWLHILVGNGQPVDGWIAVTYNGQPYCVFVEPTPGPTPTPDPDLEAFAGTLTDANGDQYDTTVTIKRKVA